MAAIASAMLLVAAVVPSQDHAADWRSGDEFFTEDVHGWETIYPDTNISLSDEVREGALSVQAASDGSEHVGLVRRLPPMDLEWDQIDHIRCWVRCSRPSNGYIRLGSSQDVWDGFWGYGKLKFPADRWMRVDIIPRYKSVYLDGVRCAGARTDVGEFDPELCQYIAFFNTYSQVEGDTLLVDGLDLSPERPWWSCGNVHAELAGNEPADPRGPYDGRVTVKRARMVWVGLYGIEELLRESSKLQFLVKTTSDARVGLVLWSGGSDKDSLRFSGWEQARGRYVLVEYVPGNTVIRVDGREIQGREQEWRDPEHMIGLQLHGTGRRRHTTR